MPKAAGEQAPIRIEATGVDSRDEPLQRRVCGEPLACVEESLEPVGRARARTNRRELDVARIASRFAPGPAVTDSHAVQFVVTGYHERVADPLRRGSDDFALEVETVEDGVRELANLVEQRGLAVSPSPSMRACMGRLAFSAIGFAATTVRLPGQKPCLW